MYFETKLETKLETIAGLNESIKTCCSKHGHQKNLFNEYKSNVIDHLSRRLNIGEFRSALRA